MKKRQKINITFALSLIAIVLITLFAPWVFGLIALIVMMGAVIYFASTVLYSIIEAIFDDD